VSQTDKARYFNELKDAGVSFDKHYREYTEAELKTQFDELVARQAPSDFRPPQAQTDPAAAKFFGFEAPSPASNPEPPPVAPVAYADPHELAGARQNTNRATDEPIRVDPDTGRLWFQEEVLKPAYPKPRGRRVLKYQDPGVRVQTIKAGEYTESFEISGDPANAREAEVKITLPSYQVGIYKDPRFPFKVVCYNGNEGFDLEDIQNYYGGAELVPEDVKRKYVENVLCYDMRSVIRAIETEYRQQQLRGSIQ
jgi:hypothetical protein